MRLVSNIVSLTRWNVITVTSRCWEALRMCWAALWVDQTGTVIGAQLQQVSVGSLSSIVWLKIRSCFPVNVSIARNRCISSQWYVSSSGCGKLFFRRLHWATHPLSRCVCPLELQLGAAVSFTVCVGTGHGGPTALLSLQNRKSTRLCDAHRRQEKHTSKGPETWGSRRRRTIRGDFFSAHGTVLLVGLEGNVSV